MLLSIGLMVKNESKHLEECLKSLMPILNEIESELIIVDTGSTDSTVQIAQRFTDKVYFHEWFDDFAGMRNVVLSYAVGEWFFYVDGDEILEDPSGIIAFFKSGRHKKYNAAFINMKNLVSSKDPQKWGFYQALRFFRKDKDFHFRGLIHEQPQAKGPVARIEGTIVHYGYIADDEELMEYKFNRNVALISKVLEKDPENIYHLYQLSQSYAMYKKHGEALGPIEKAYNLAKAKGLLSRYMYVVIQLASVYFNCKMFQECERICLEGLRIKDGYLDLYYFLAASQVELGKLEESVVAFEKYLSLVREYELGKGTVDFSITHRMVGFTEHAYVTLCEIYNKQGNFQMAVESAHKVKSPSLVKQVVPCLVEIYLKQEDLQAIKDLYDKWQHDESVALSIEMAIENKRLTMETEQKRALSRLFAVGNNTYALLNLARRYCLDRVEAIPPDFWHQVAALKLSRNKVYYGDFVLLYIRYERSLIELLGAVPSDGIIRYFTYLFGIDNELLGEFRSYVSLNKIWDTEDEAELYRVKAAVLYAVLQQKALSNDDYEFFFRLYLEIGKKYIEACYNSRILDMGSVSWASNAGDAFLMVMRRAVAMKRTSAEYVQCLREALAVDPSMKRGIEILLNEAQSVLSSPQQDEFNKLKLSVQASIENAINKGNLETAAALINEYEQIVGVDAALCAFKGIMFMIDGNLEEARNYFLLGLRLEPDNDDLLYNLNYLNSL